MDTLQKFLDDEANKIVDWYTWGFESYHRAIQDCYIPSRFLMSKVDNRYSFEYQHEYFSKKFPHIYKFIHDDWTFDKDGLKKVVVDLLNGSYESIESEILSICSSIHEQEFKLSEYGYLIGTYYCTFRDCIAYIHEVQNYKLNKIKLSAEIHHTKLYWHFIKENEK